MNETLGRPAGDEEGLGRNIRRKAAALAVTVAYMGLALGAAKDAHVIRLALLVYSALAFIWFCEELAVAFRSSARTVAALGWALLAFPALAYTVAVIVAVFV